MGQPESAGKGQEDPSKDQAVQDQVCTDETHLPGGEAHPHIEDPLDFKFLFEEPVKLTFVSVL